MLLSLLPRSPSCRLPFVPDSNAENSASAGGIEFKRVVTDDRPNTKKSQRFLILKRIVKTNRGKFCVVLVGYREEMQRMISSNPGLEFRIQFTLEFPDYTSALRIPVFFLRWAQWSTIDLAVIVTPR